jgi:hypothetical protein
VWAWGDNGSGQLGTGVAIVLIMRNVLDMPDFTTAAVAIVGIGVGIDYALFIVTRYRENLAAGLDPERSVVRAIDTAGRAFSLLLASNRNSVRLPEASSYERFSTRPSFEIETLSQASSGRGDLGFKSTRVDPLSPASAERAYSRESSPGSERKTIGSRARSAAESFWTESCLSSGVKRRPSPASYVNVFFSGTS